MTTTPEQIAAMWRALAERAISVVDDAVRETDWGQPTFGPDAHEELMIGYNAIIEEIAK